MAILKHPSNRSLLYHRLPGRYWLVRTPHTLSVDRCRIESSRLIQPKFTPDTTLSGALAHDPFHGQSY
jgi:hypothetical protein